MSLKVLHKQDPDGKGGFIYNLNGITPILYNLKELQRARNENLTVFIVEGEKDVETFQKNNVVSTTCAMGAVKWKTTYNEHFKNVSVVIIPDNDEVGKSHALDIAKSLYKMLLFTTFLKKYTMILRLKH